MNEPNAENPQLPATQEHELLPTHYVGIGASAGGLEAIDTFFKSMDPASGLAFIVIQHLSPDHKSLMAELMAKRTLMKVNRAEEGMLVEANNVYLIPPNHNLRIFHGRLLLTKQNRHGGVYLPIDIFFQSLAEDQGEKAIGIILSGTGSDGSRGIRAIKEKVGMVMAQDEESAGFDGMPRAAIATGLVDYVLPPGKMPEQLVIYAKHPYAGKMLDQQSPQRSDESALNRVFAILREKTGIDFTLYKPNTVTRRIERRMSVNQINSMNDYVRFLESSNREIDHLHKDLLIGVTSFFRDEQAFAKLSDTWLPALFKRKSNRQIRFWVAGCSTGEEAYSLAILCQEIIDHAQMSVDLKIFATDVDREAVTLAGAGMYADSIVADVPKHLLSKYFIHTERGFQISRRIRETVVFAHHNIIKDPPFTNIDMISCRNLLIYLQPVLQRRVMEMFNFSLNNEGILFLGTSETTGEMSEYFDQLDNQWKIYRSRGRQIRRALSASTSNFDAHARLSQEAAPKARTPGLSKSYPEEERILERLVQGAYRDFLPFTLVVNAHMELQYIVGDATDYLQLPTGKMHNDITKLTHQDLAIPMSTGIQKVLNSKQDFIYSNIHLRTGKESRVVQMRIRLLPTRKGQDPLLAIFIEPNRPPETNDKAPANSHDFDMDKESRQRILDLEQELQFSRENLQATVEELETSNEELQATNEELLASNEELQSTNEELQSVNEELYTVNAEYQGKIGELTEVNNDLDNLLANIRIGTLFLDENLEIRRYTPEISKYFRIIEHDIGRHFSHITHDLQDVDLIEIVTRCNETHRVIEQEITTIYNEVFLMRALPYRVGPEIYAGVILNFVNINALQMARDTEERYLLTQDTTQSGDWTWDIESDVLQWSDNIETMFGLEPGTFERTYQAFLKRVHPDDRKRVDQTVEDCLRDPHLNYLLEHRIQLPNGQVRWVRESGKVHRNLSGKPLRMIGVVQDITESKLNRFKLQSILSAAPAGFGLVNQRILQWVNPRIEQMTGYSTQELIGESSRILYPSDEEYAFVGAEKYRQIRECGVGTVQTQWRRKDGEIFPVLLSSVPINPQDIDDGVTFTALDLNDLMARQYPSRQNSLRHCPDDSEKSA